MHVLPLLDHTQRAVVNVNDFDGQTILGTGRQLLNIHLNTSLPGNAGHNLIRKCSLHAHCRGQTKAHRPQTSRVDPLSRLIERVVLRSKHLVLSYIRRYERRSPCHFVNRLNNLLRHNCLTILVGRNRQTIDVSPALNLIKPLCDMLTRSGFVLFRFVSKNRNHVVKHGFYRAHNRHIDNNIFRYRRRIDIDMNDFCVRAKFRYRICHSIIKSRAYG